nr:hypothetical protein [Sphingomonas deserti]
MLDDGGVVAEATKFSLNEVGLHRLCRRAEGLGPLTLRGLAECDQVMFNTLPRLAEDIRFLAQDLAFQPGETGFGPKGEAARRTKGQI